MSDDKFNILTRLGELAEYARRGDKFLPDEICSFIIREFELTSAAIFRVGDNYTLNVIGKSGVTPESIQHGSSFSCSVCQSIFEDSAIKLNTRTLCQIQISDYLAYEICCLIPVVGVEKYLIKLANRNGFSDELKKKIESILPFIALIVSSWHVNSAVSPVLRSLSLPQIVSETSQEIKNAAQSVLGLTNAVSNEILSSTQSEYLGSLKRTVQNILLIVNDLNELNKIESGSTVKNVKKIELTALVSEIISLFKNKLNKKISFTVGIDKELTLPIDLDDQKLKYILTGLLFVSSTLTTQGEITIQISAAAGNMIRFFITDTGRPIKKEAVDNLYDPFIISKQDEFRNSTLSGLSLTLIKKYINYLGGDITVTSTPGKGNSFSFTISGDKMSVLESNISQLPKPISKNKVLVIEDDYATSRLLTNYLNKWGYSPVIVNNELQAFNSIEKEELLAVILDIEIPDTNGLELLKRIHEHPRTKNTPVIVCSIEPEKQKAFMMGAVEYFVKPINYNFLVEVLTNYKLRKNSRILCVDDDLPTLNLIKQAIESSGFIAVAEHISANVMNSIKDKDIDLAIIDLDMPAPNGFELIKLIKSEKKFTNLPIIIYTGKENYRDDLSKIEGMFEELLDKRSTNIEDLAGTINAMINRYETPPPVEEVIHKQNVIKILLAEDYKHSQIIVTRLLKKNNFENVVVVENGEDAVNMANNEKFDLILMDMQMPIMNGFEATEKIREMPGYKSTPIIALTAFAMKGDREKCLEAGATDYIPKPIDSKEFIEKVKYYTNSLA